MPKNKTHKGLLKRVRITKTGKVKHKRCGGSHLKSNKSGSKVRELRTPQFMASSEAKRVSKLLYRRIRGRTQPRATLRKSPSPEERRAQRESAKSES